ncbi:MAG: hypothetical protein LBQ01_02220 [Prevotellaceae bacterium]|jgi:hypothetical protein|nr:hypothetical protein [Prevotellaceae bacterium]
MIGLIIVLLIVGAVLYFKFSADPKELRERGKGRSAEQKQALRYFFNDGCLQKKVSDEAYDAMVDARVKSFNAKAKAMAKIGLDESELKEIDPVHFEGYYFDPKKSYAKRGKDGKWRSSAYQISWLFFSAMQVYLYQYTFNMDEDGKKEATEEYFYKDITNFSTSSDTVESPYWDPKQKKMMLENVDSNRFSLVVPGDKFFCSMEQNEYTERAIQGMKAKLREKKNR